MTSLGVTVDDTLVDWADVDGTYDTLLLGNGFSINLSNSFAYSSLREKAAASSAFSQAAIDLFTHKNTDNFETILELLDDACAADAAISDGQTTTLEGVRTNVQDALITTVRAIHVAHAQLDATGRFGPISDGLRQYQHVFTTNYDLIPYWAFLTRTNEDYFDYFWSGAGTDFSPGNTDVWSTRQGDTRLLYLHGALHLRSQGGVDRKVTTASGPLLDVNTWNPFLTGSPLFVTEGSAAQKISRIYSSPYLSFVFGEFRHNESNVVVLGHSLGSTYRHLTDAMGTWGSRHVAFGIWPGLDAHQIIDTKNQLLQALPNISWHFFSSSTHPLGA